MSKGLERVVIAAASLGIGFVAGAYGLPQKTEVHEVGVAVSQDENANGMRVEAIDDNSYLVLRSGGPLVVEPQSSEPYSIEGAPELRGGVFPNTESIWVYELQYLCEGNQPCLDCSHAFCVDPPPPLPGEGKGIDSGFLDAKGFTPILITTRP